VESGDEACRRERADAIRPEAVDRPITGLEDLPGEHIGQIALQDPANLGALIHRRPEEPQRAARLGLFRDCG
jgi:hypothetical protein